MSAPLEPIPEKADVLEQATISRRWYLWLYALWARVVTNVSVVGAAFVRANQVAAIVAATVYTVTQTGLYRVSYEMRVTTLPSVSFSLTMTLGWRSGGVTKSQVFTALTGAPGTLATDIQNGSIFVRADSGTVITASVAYASVGTAMAYATDVIVELIS